MNPFEPPRTEVPVKVVPGERGSVPRKALFSGGYWLVTWGIFLFLVVVAVAIYLINGPTFLWLVHPILASFYAIARSMGTALRAVRDSRRTLQRRIQGKEFRFYFLSLIWGFLATIASTIAFVVLCVPLGFVAFDIHPITGSSGNSDRAITLIAIFSGFIGFLCGLFIIILTIPPISREIGPLEAIPIDEGQA